jgi:hypothetical protein
MRHKIHFIALLLAAGAILLATCEKKKDEEVDPLVGVYQFGSATLNDTVSITVPVYGSITMMPGNNADLFVTEGLLGAAPCDNSDSTAVEIQDDGKIFYTCLGEDIEEQMGTWMINTERTILTLNISNPQAFALTISDLNITPTSFSGTVENFPLPLDANYELGEELPGGGTNYQTASVDLTFTRVP